MTDAVLVLGDYQQSIVVVRSLARAGCRVIVGQSFRRAFSALSRYAADTWRHQDLQTPAGLADLQALLDERPITWIFPVGESEIAALLPIHERLAARVRVAMPPPTVVRCCLDKPSSYRLADSLGVPVARTALATDQASLETEAELLGAPVVIKCPDSSRLVAGRKALVCERLADLERWRLGLSGADYPLVVQRWAPGSRHNCHFAAAHGTLTAFFQQQVLRTDEPDGTGFGVEGVSVEPSPALRRHCEALARHLQYHGVGCAQFLVDDRTDAHVFLELNPRLDATCELAYRCGIDLPRLALDPATAAPDRYPTGRRFHWLLGDSRGLMRRVKARELSRRDLGTAVRQLARAHWRAHYHLTGDWTDPAPALYLYAQLLAAGGRTVLKFAGRTAGPH